MMATILLLFSFLQGGTSQAAPPDWDYPAAPPIAAVAFTPPGLLPAGPAIAPSQAITYYVFLPAAHSQPAGCAPIPGVVYHTLDVTGKPTDRPAELHGDLNLALRGYAVTDEYRGLVDYAGGDDAAAPQLNTLFADGRVPAFPQVYRVYEWDWGCNCRGDLLAYPAVTLAGMGAAPGEVLRLPDSGYNIGDGYEALVLYASEERITLKYTREDNVVLGYTIHIENVCVEPSLLALYRQWNEAGRERLPALRGGQPLGRAIGGEIGVAIRDTGTFMDPRARQSWWVARQALRPGTRPAH